MDEAEETNNNTQQKEIKTCQKEHFWLNPQLIEHLPVNIQKGKDQLAWATKRNTVQMV